MLDVAKGSKNFAPLYDAECSSIGWLDLTMVANNNPRNDWHAKGLASLEPYLEWQPLGGPPQACTDLKACILRVQ